MRLLCRGAGRAVLSLGVGAFVLTGCGASPISPTVVPAQATTGSPSTATSTVNVPTATIARSSQTAISGGTPPSAGTSSPVTTRSVAGTQAPIASRTGGNARATTTAAPNAVQYEADFSRWFSGALSEPIGVRAAYDVTRREYQLALTQPGQFGRYWRFAPEGRGFADFRLDIDARRIAGPDNGGSYGVVLRAQPQAPGDATNARLSFFIYPEGAFALLYNDGADNLITIAPVTTMPSIGKGESSNHITVICVGDSVTVSVNGESLGTFDVPLVTAGAIGVVISQPRNATGPAAMAAAFSNLRVTAAP